MNSWDKTKQKIWRNIYQYFPTLQKFALKMDFHEKGRQRYHIGWLTPGKTLEDLKVYPQRQGSGPCIFHFFLIHVEFLYFISLDSHILSRFVNVLHVRPTYLLVSLNFSVNSL